MLAKILTPTHPHLERRCGQIDGAPRTNNTAQPVALSKLRNRPSSTHLNGQLMVKPAHSGRVSNFARLGQFVQRHSVGLPELKLPTVTGGGKQHRATSACFPPSLLGAERSRFAHRFHGGRQFDQQCSAPATRAGQLAQSRPGPSAQPRLDRMGAKGRVIRRTNRSKSQSPSATARRTTQSCPSLTRGAAVDQHCSAPAVSAGQLARSRPGPLAQSRPDWMGMEGRRIRSTNQV
jgi:hypothetical protein